MAYDKRVRHQKQRSARSARSTSSLGEGNRQNVILYIVYMLCLNAICGGTTRCVPAQCVGGKFSFLQYN